MERIRLGKRPNFQWRPTERHRYIALEWTWRAIPWKQARALARGTLESLLCYRPPCLFYRHAWIGNSSCCLYSQWNLNLKKSMTQVLHFITVYRLFMCILLRKQRNIAVPNPLISDRHSRLKHESGKTQLTWLLNIILNFNSYNREGKFLRQPSKIGESSLCLPSLVLPKTHATT